MITWELILAISVYNFIMYATPGPNNSILTASGIKFGFVRTIPNIFGIPLGHGLQLALVALGLHSLQHRGQEGCGIVSFDGKNYHSETRYPRR